MEEEEREWERRLEKLADLRQDRSMDEPVIEYDKAAFRHGFTIGDIEWAIRTSVFGEPLIDEGEGTYMLVGFDRAGNLLEVAYRELDDGSYYVFHAMRCRPQWRTHAGV
ncbi:MAG: hypothetical protein LBQ44_10140 [Treponema sp.]|nr:hypothetical protein [Treponema sp.]